MRWLLTALLAALLSTGATACAGQGGSPGRAPPGPTKSESQRSSSSARTGIRHGDSEDFDNDASGDDDIAVLSFGHAASTTEARAMTSLVKRYYTAAAAEEGASACSMLVAPLAETVPEEFDRAGEAQLHGSSCAEVLSKLYKREHAHIAAELASLEVTRVRVEGAAGLVVLRFATTREGDRFDQILRFLSMD